MLLSFENLSFTYEGAMTPLLSGVSVQFPQGWSGIVGANGAGKTTLLRLACGELEPQGGTVRREGAVLYCAQRTDDPPPLLRAFAEAVDGEACRLRGLLRLQPDWPERWESLSDGERKRAQIGVALWQTPQVLAIDEPTNHIDAEARDLLARALRSFRGIGLLVSHDRELLDTLCLQCLFVEPPAVRVRPGGYTQASAQARREEEHAVEERERAKQAVDRLHRELTERRRDAASQALRFAKRKLDLRDHDGREKIDRARLAGKDSRAGRLVSQLAGRIRQAEELLGQAEVRKEHRLGIWLPGSCSRRDLLLHQPAGSLDLGGGRRLAHPELAMAPTDRVAVTGPNGSGKSTLIRRIVTRLDLPPERVTYLPQEISRSESRRVLAEVAALPHEALGHVMTVVSRLGSRPHRLLESEEPSPGEVRKLLLALGVARSPHLIILDEPTNHLDLPAIECLEQALEDCPCGLLLVSHDLRFLGRLARTRWHLSPGPGDEVVLSVTDALGLG